MTDPDGKAPQWLRDYYDDVDNMRLEPYLDHHVDDVVVQFGNNPRAHGREQVGGAIGHFWELIDGLEHNVVEVYEAGDTTILEAVIDYTRKDGEVVSVPCTTLLRRAGEKVDFVRIYIDLVPVFSPSDTAAEQPAI